MLRKEKSIGSPTCRLRRTEGGGGGDGNPPPIMAHFAKDFTKRL